MFAFLIETLNTFKEHFERNRVWKGTKHTLCQLIQTGIHLNISQDLMWISISSMLESTCTAGCKTDHGHGQRPMIRPRLEFHLVVSQLIPSGSVLDPFSVLCYPDMICFPYLNDLLSKVKCDSVEHPCCCCWRAINYQWRLVRNG